MSSAAVKSFHWICKIYVKSDLIADNPNQACFEHGYISRTAIKSDILTSIHALSSLQSLDLCNPNFFLTFIKIATAINRRGNSFPFPNTDNRNFLLSKSVFFLAWVLWKVKNDFSGFRLKRRCNMPTSHAHVRVFSENYITICLIS